MHRLKASSKLIPVFIALCMGCTPTAPNGTSAPPNTRFRKIDQVISKQIRDKRKLGIVVGIFDNGKVAFRSYGKAALKGKAPLNKDSIFEIASVTKVFTTIAIAALVRKGKLKLEDPVTKHVPELEGGPLSGTTLESLATHTSGLPGMFLLKQIKDPLNPFKDLTERQFLDAANSLETLEPKPSFSHRNYSNIGVTLLGIVVSRTSGLSYRDFVLREVVHPLNLTSTYFEVPEVAATKFLAGHNAELQETPHWDFKVFAPAGALRSSAVDMMKFVEANIKSDSQSSESILVDLAYTQKLRAFGKDLDIGLAWYFDKKTNVHYHRGGTFGFTSIVAFQKQKKLGLVILSNTGYQGDRVFVEGVEKLIFGRDLAL
jgi:CubicO group peptidase (beta-lactamase class C family)